MATFELPSRRTCCTIIFAVSCLFNQFIEVVAQNGTADRNQTGDYQYCPVGQFGYFADRTNCSRAVRCTNGQPTGFHPCPVGKHWHVTGLGFGLCDQPTSAGCQLSQLTPVPDPIGLPIDPDPVEQFVCPRTLLCNRKSVDGQYGDPFNCSRFYLCIDGQSFVSSCPAGMSWSERVGHCHWSRLAHCDLRLLQRYGLECVDDDQFTTNARPTSDVSNTTTDCSTNDCSLTTSDFTASSNSTNEARLASRHNVPNTIIILALSNLISTVRTRLAY